MKTLNDYKKANLFNKLQMSEIESSRNFEME